jgi:hypothetical protein
MNWPKHFKKWKQHHVARYTLTQQGLRRPGGGFAPGAQLRLLLPPRFTQCVQQLPDGGAWMLPAAEREEWLMVKPLPVDGG